VKAYLPEKFDRKLKLVVKTGYLPMG